MNLFNENDRENGPISHCRSRFFLSPTDSWEPFYQSLSFGNKFSEAIALRAGGDRLPAGQGNRTGPEFFRAIVKQPK